ATLTVSVAKFVVAVAHELVNTARYFLPVSAVTAVKLSVVDVAPGMSLNPDPVSTCHCTVGAGLPVADAVKLAVVLSQTVVLTGAAVPAGAVVTMIGVTTVVVLPHASVNTARYFLPLSPAASMNESVVDVAPGMSVKPEPLSTCH